MASAIKQALIDFGFHENEEEMRCAQYFETLGFRVSGMVGNFAVGDATELDLDENSHAVFISASMRRGLRGIMRVTSNQMILFLEDYTCYIRDTKQNFRDFVVEVNVNVDKIILCDLLHYDGVSRGTTLVRHTLIGRIVRELKDPIFDKLWYQGDHLVVRKFEERTNNHNVIVFTRLNSLRSFETTSYNQYYWYESDMHAYCLDSFDGYLVTDHGIRICKSDLADGTYCFDKNYKVRENYDERKCMGEYQYVKTHFLMHMGVREMVLALDGKEKMRFRSLDEIIAEAIRIKGHIEHPHAVTELVQCELMRGGESITIVSKNERVGFTIPIADYAHELKYAVFKLNTDESVTEITYKIIDNFKIKSYGKVIAFTLGLNLRMTSLGKMHDTKLLRVCVGCSCSHCNNHTFWYTDFRFMASRCATRKQLLMKRGWKFILRTLTDGINDIMELREMKGVVPVPISKNIGRSGIY